MMDKQHCIESAIFKISYSSEELALSQHNELEAFAKNELLPIVDEAFTEISGPDSVLWFEKLEVDLGEISLSYFFQDFSAKLREKIREALQTELRQSQLQPGDKVEEKSATNSELEIACRYLATGRLPWNARLNDAHQVEELLISVLQNSADELIASIRAASDRNAMISRLAAQFSPRVLGLFMQHLSELSASEACETIETVLASCIETYGLSRSDVQRRVWAELLQFALLNKSGRLESRTLLQQLIRKLAMLVPQRFSVFVDRLLQAIDRRAGRGRLHEQVLAAARDCGGNDLLDRAISDELVSSQAEREDERKSELEERSRRLAGRARLVEALNTGSTARLQALWSSLLAQYAEMVKDVIVSLGQNAHIRRNIARHFQETMIRDIVALLEPTNHRFIEQLVSEPRLYLDSHEELQMGEAEAKKSLWEFTLTYLLVERGSRFNRKSYIASVMAKLAAHVNVDLMELYESIMVLLLPVAKNDPMRAELLSLLRELKVQLPETESSKRRQAEAAASARNGSGDSSGTAPASGDDAEAPRAAQELLAEELLHVDSEAECPPAAAIDALVAALQRSDLAALKAAWRQLTGRYARWLAAVFRSEARQEKVRKNIASTFTNPMFRDVIQLLEPVHGEFVAEVVQSATRKPRVEGRRPPAPEKTRRIVREFTLSYLVVDRGSRFNKRSYLAALLKRMAAHENVSVQAIFQSINDSVQSIAKRNSLQRELAQLLVEAADDLRIQGKTQGSRSKPAIELASEKHLQSAPEREAEGRARGRSTESDRELEQLEQLEHIRSYLLYEKLLSAIVTYRGSGSSISYHVIRLLHELIQNYPWMLHRFNQEVNAGQLALAPVIAQLPRSLQRKLVLSFFDSFAARYRFSKQDFESRLSAVEAGEKISNVFYSQILGRLIGNRVQHLDAIFAAEGADAASAQGGEASAAKAGDGSQGDNQESISAYQEQLAAESRLRESTPLSLNQGTSDLIRAYLLGNLNVIEQDKLSIVSTIDLLLSSHPATLARLLRESLIDKSASDRLVEIVPESLLVKLMLLLRPDDQYKAILYADLVTMAAAEAEASGSAQSRTLHLAKWQFIFNYMVIEGKRFSEISFVRRFAAFLQQRSNARTEAEFTQKLTSNLAATASSTTHVPSVRIAMILQSGASSAQAAEHAAGGERTEEAAKSIESAAGRRAEANDERDNDIDPAEAFMRGIAERDREERAREAARESARNSAQEAASRQSSIRDQLLGEEPRRTDSFTQDSGQSQVRDEAGESSSRLGYWDSEDDSDVLEDVYIDNAGLVLLAPYLPRYFDMVGLLDGKQFRDPAAAERGVHLLQYLVNESTDSPEYQLVLNKLLCGVKAGVPICRSIEITDQEKEASDGLLKGVIGNWPMLKNTSVEGLRETFLQREAHLQLKVDAWHLLVQSKAFDMLLDSLPWGYSTIKLGWMRQPVYVDWR